MQLAKSGTGGMLWVHETITSNLLPPSIGSRPGAMPETDIIQSLGLLVAGSMMAENVGSAAAEEASSQVGNNLKCEQG